MCGIAVLAGDGWSEAALARMASTQAHRGPDASGTWIAPDRVVGMAHNRLAILDLDPRGGQPMADPSGRWTIGFNGEIYNYLELRRELEARHRFRTGTDTEVLLAAWEAWGEACLERLIGMFAFVVWDARERRLFAARDRFGVKPLYLHEPAGGGLWLASEIKALHAAGLAPEPDAVAWATYLASGMYDHGERTFWEGVRRVPPGARLSWTPEDGLELRSWYDPAAAALAAGPEERDEDEVADELLALLEESVRLRFRSDVPVGVCLSGGLDSSLLTGLIRRVLGPDTPIRSYTFHTGDPRYDELPWVESMLEGSAFLPRYCRLAVEDVPELAERVQGFQDEPYGGLPTLGMARVHGAAAGDGVTVLLDGNGLDEGWAGYDYYRRASEVPLARGPVQGSADRSPGAACLAEGLARLVERWVPERPFGDPLADLQHRDLRHAKIPRAMRFADRVSMMFSRELREPFLDHRIVELGLRQPADRKIRDGRGKWLARRVAEGILPPSVREAPKRPVQTPQREWLRGPLAGWAGERIDEALEVAGGEWLDPAAVRGAWRRYREGEGDNSFFVWQWISLALCLRGTGDRVAGTAADVREVP